MIRIEQSNPFSCLAATAAMIVGSSERDVFDVIGHDGTSLAVVKPFPEVTVWRDTEHRRPILIGEIAWYLHTRGFRLGLCAYPITETGQVTGLAFAASTQYPALLIVDGANLKHAVFWTGREVLDPKPGRVGPYDLDDYKIFEWWPVARVAPWRDSAPGLARPTSRRH